MYGCLQMTNYDWRLDQSQLCSLVSRPMSI